MRRVGLALAILLGRSGLGAGAESHDRPARELGRWSVLETVPTAGGGQPTNTVHPAGGGVGVRRIRRPRLDGRERRFRGRRERSRLRPSARSPEQGPDGVAAAALAQATAPRGASSHASAERRRPRLRRSPAASTERWIVAHGERVQGLDRLDRRRWRRAAVADRPDRQRARRRRCSRSCAAAARAEPARGVRVRLFVIAAVAARPGRTRSPRHARSV